MRLIGAAFKEKFFLFAFEDFFGTEFCVYKYDYMSAIKECSKLKNLPMVQDPCCCFCVAKQSERKQRPKCICDAGFLLLLRLAIPQTLGSAQFGWWFTALGATTT